MISAYRPDHFQPTRDQDLDERNHGLRGPQHNTQDPNCRVASIYADSHTNLCTICRPEGTK